MENSVRNEQGASGFVNGQMPNYTVLYCEFPENVLGAAAEDLKHPVKLKLLGHIPIDKDVKDMKPPDVMEQLRSTEDTSELFFLPLKDSDLILVPPSPTVNKRKHSENKCSYCGNVDPLWDTDQQVCLYCAGTFAKCKYSDAKTKECCLCNATFVTLSALYTHVKDNHKTAMFKCIHCSKCFINRTHLKLHMHTHTGEKPFGCQTCGKHFSLRGNMLRHKYTVHVRVAPHSCLICNKKFSSPYLMHLHQRVHLDEKPYQCADCPKSFRIRSDMVHHTAVHCHSKFKTKGRLNEHLWLPKTDSPGYRCKECGGLFNKSSIFQHLKTAHS